jgi:hypothetical protein
MTAHAAAILAAPLPLFSSGPPLDGGAGLMGYSDSRRKKSRYPRSSESTIWLLLFACASAEMPDCARI